MTAITDPTLFKYEEDNKNTVSVEGDGRVYDAPAGWFKIMQTDHKKQGLQFIIPLKHPEYSDKIQTTLTNLEEGDTLWMECIATNKQNTAWRCHSITEDNTPKL